MKLAGSELIINNDGSIFHLHIKPNELASTVILVGDPSRVEMVSDFLEKIYHEGANREFVWKTGELNGKLFTVLSTGIGTDNIDIVLTELDALVNVDFEARTVKEEKKSLNIIRIGTSGALQPNIPVDSWLLSEKAIGMDGLLNFYAGRNDVCDLEFEREFVKFMNWNSPLAIPYVVDADESLLSLLMQKTDAKDVGPIKGVTATASGFYGPQGRVIRLQPSIVDLNENLSRFDFNGKRITNFEMECSAIYGLSAMLGHKAATVCLIIANRMNGTFSKNYQIPMKEMIKHVLKSMSN